MNKTLYLLALVLLRCIAAFAQQTAGTATYEIHRAQNPGSFTLSEEDRKKLPLQVQMQLQAGVAEPSQNMLLDFDSQKAWFHKGAESVSEEQSGSTRFSVQTKTEGSGQEVYRDLAKNEEINISALNGQNYRTTAPLKPLPWKLGDETKQIAGHTCYKATLPGEPIRRIINGKEDLLPAKEIVAWYTNDIPVEQGPGRYYGLSGLILQVDEGLRTITCTGVDLGVPKTAPKPPTTGKATTNAELDKLREAYISKMTGSGNGNSQIRIEQH